MKKKIIATALIATMVLSLTACGGNEEVEQSNSDANESQTTVQEETENIEETVVGEVNRDIPFWILQQDFSIPQKEFEGTLYNETMTMPLDLTTLDAYSTSYKWRPDEYSDIREYVSSVTEILSSDDCFLYPSDTKIIYTQDDGENDIGQFDEGYCGIGDFEFFNMSETETLSVKQCYENGWWQIIQTDSGNHAMTLQVEAGDDYEMLDRFLEKMGSPTYIAGPWDESYNSLDAYFATMEVESVESYYMIYEYEDFTFVIMVTDNSFGTLRSVKISGTYYYPNTMWELKKSEYHLIPVN